MDRISFTIFSPDGKKFHLTPNWIVYGLWVITGFLLWLFDSQIQPHSSARSIILIIIGVITFGFLAASFFTYMPLNGTLDGDIIFGADNITINNEVFYLKNISKLDFWFGDYYGQMDSSYRGSFNPLIRQGVNNSVTFINDINKTHTIYFRMMGKHSSTVLYDFINEAVKLRVMLSLRAEDLIGAENVVKS